MFSSQTVPCTGHIRPRAARAEAHEDDQTLLDGLLSDDPRAWRTFNARYSRLLYGCIARIVARFGSVVTKDDIREIYATLCLQLLANDKRKLRSFEASRGNKLGSWLGMLAVHATYDYLRTLKREPKWGKLAEAERLTSNMPSPYQMSLLKQRAHIISELMTSFSDKDRQFIELYFGDGLAPEAIAEHMNISIKTVYSKKHKIICRLESLLAERRLAA